MKINQKFRRQPVEQQSTEVTGGGHNYTSSTRFKNIEELRGRYLRAKGKRENDKAWEDIIRSYDRVPWKEKSTGARLPNFGTLRYKVDQALTTYVDFATERETWAVIKTDFGDSESASKNYSEQITWAFQNYCIANWKKRFAAVMLACKDMLLFSKGAWHFKTKFCCYPEHVSISHVLPDTNAGMFADSFDTLFVPRRFTAVELYRRVMDEELAEKTGWRKDAVLALLKSSNVSYKDHSLNSIYLRFKSGEADADECDHIIDVVFAYVKEYKDKDAYGQSTDEYKGEGYDGYCVSEYVFPSNGYIPGYETKNRLKNNQASETGFLFYKSHYYECMDQCISILAHTVCENFYEDPSFAQLIYMTTKVYDQVMNRVLMAIEDNMRVYLSSDSSVNFDKLQRMRHGMYQVLEPGVKLDQQRIQRPVADSIEVLRRVTVDQNAGTGQYTIGEQAERGTPKTAAQSQIDLAESVKVSSAHLKIFNSFMKYPMEEIFRRFTNPERTTGRDYENFQKFKKFLEAKKVPKKAWAMSNVQVDSVVSLGAGSPSAKLQASRIVLETLATPARSKGEHEAKRDIISAAVGVDNVDKYLPADGDYAIPEDALIGLENDALSDPYANPNNIKVQQNQLHLRHAPAHIMDAEQSVAMAGRLFQNGLPNMAEEDQGVMLKTITDILIGIDNKLSHAIAHLQIAGQTGNPQTKAEIQAMMQKVQEINKQQDKLEQIIGEVQQKRLEESRAKNGTDPELQHKQAMYALEEEHTATMLAFDMQKSQMKSEQLIRNSADHAEHKKNLDTIKTQHEIEKKNLQSQLETAIKLRNASVSTKTQK